jgi:signal transduction histidine kinase
MPDEARFAQIVSIGAHDLKTPLATVYGFARTLARTELDDTAARYVAMIEAASIELRELMQELSLVALIQLGRYDPRLVEVDSLELARDAVAELAERVDVSGEGAGVQADPEATGRALSRLAKAATRHGGIDSVSLVVHGRELAVSPLMGNAPGVVTGEDLKELGAAAAVEHLRALGVSVGVDGQRLLISFPG